MSGERNVEINIGKLCDNDCLFCANGAVPAIERAWVSRDIVMAEIDRAAEQGYRSIGFLGGEIAVYPDAAGIIGHARESGFERISICTNGRALSRKGVLEPLIDAGVTRISISIHSDSAEVEDRLCGRKGVFKQKVAAIKSCVRLADQGSLVHGFSINACMHGLNIGRLAEIAAFFSRLGVRDLRFNSLRPENRAAGDPTLVPRLSACVPEMMRLVLANERELKMTVTFGDIPICVWPRSFIENAPLAGRYIGELRDLNTSVTVFRGRGGDGSPDRFSWRERRQDRLKKHAGGCGGCRAAGVCEGYWIRYFEMYGDGEIHAIR